VGFDLLPGEDVAPARRRTNLAPPPTRPKHDSKGPPPRTFGYAPSFIRLEKVGTDQKRCDNK
jgi:hypothetical protein